MLEETHIAVRIDCACADLRRAGTHHPPCKEEATAWPPRAPAARGSGAAGRQWTPTNSPWPPPPGKLAFPRPWTDPNSKGRLAKAGRHPLAPSLQAMAAFTPRPRRPSGWYTVPALSEVAHPPEVLEDAAPGGRPRGASAAAAAGDRRGGAGAPNRPRPPGDQERKHRGPRARRGPAPGACDLDGL